MRSGSAVARRTANSAVTDEDPFLADLQGFVWNNQGTNRTWQNLADEAGLSYTTVWNFATGTTKRPQERTVRKLMQALGFRLAFVPASMPTIVGEVRLEQYRNTKG
jgi:DNA-binding phage protein